MVQILESEHQYNFLSKTFILLPMPKYLAIEIFASYRISIHHNLLKCFIDYMKNKFYMNSLPRKNYAFYRVSHLTKSPHAIAIQALRPIYRESGTAIPQYPP